MLESVPHSHCHHCGTRHVDSSFPKKCQGCDTTTWINPTPVAVLLQPITDSVRRGILIGLRGFEPAKNKWGLTGGFMETFDDGAEDGMVREYREETRLPDPDEVQLMFSAGNGPLDQPHLRQVLIFGFAKRALPIHALNGFEPDEETLALDVAWEPRELAFDTHTRALALWFERYQGEVDWEIALESNAP